MVQDFRLTVDYQAPVWCDSGMAACMPVGCKNLSYRGVEYYTNRPVYQQKDYSNLEEKQVKKNH
jgi:hypothetical protein